MGAREFWEAARAFRAAAQGTEDHHTARVRLIRFALNGEGMVRQRAADLLRSEGLIVVNCSHTITRAHI